MDFKCEVCRGGIDVRVASMPGMAMSLAICGSCRSQDIYPLWALLANTALIGGMRNAATFWYEMVHSSLPFYGITCEQFDVMVDEDIAKMEARMREDLI